LPDEPGRYTLGKRFHTTVTTTKTAISLDEDLLRRVDAVAEELHEPRSRVLARAAEEFLRRLENRRILERLDRAHAEEIAEPREARKTELRRAHHRELVKGEW
jgi:predicted transcriptional regulator